MSLNQTEAITTKRESFLRREWRLFKKNRELFWLALPGVIFKLIFSYLPLIGLIIAFKNFRYDLGMWGSEWVGFKNSWGTASSVCVLRHLIAGQHFMP